MENSLWGDEFKVENSRERSKELINKTSKSKTKKAPDINSSAAVLKNVSLDDKLAMINQNVDRVLGVYKSSTITIKSFQEFENYISKAISNGIIAIDTETNNSLDPLTCKIMGLCLYTPGMKSAYVPVNHVDRYTNERFDWQVTEEEIETQLNRLGDVKVLTHNGKFDYQVIKCTCDYAMNIYWDSMIAAKIIDENEKHAAKPYGLKAQYIHKIDPAIEHYSIDKLFESLEYAMVDPDVFALYSATDAYMTFKLYEWQIAELSKPGNERLLKLLYEVEFPIVKISAEMELSGIELDLEYTERLKIKYENKLKDIEEEVNKELEKLAPQINAWRLTEEANKCERSKKQSKDGTYKLQKSKNQQLQDPPAVSSAIQLAILLYDIIKLKPVDPKSPRATGEAELKQLEHPLCQVILKYRKTSKLLNTFIETLPTTISPRDGRVHSKFNQLDTVTGRFTSAKPNLQQIPSGNVEIRMMFKASKGKVLVGSDYSQQEPRCLTAFSQDEKLLDAYTNNKDLYATLGTGVYKNDYWENMEHWEDGTPNIEGKKRRKKMKTLYLGMTYGMQAKTLSERLGCSTEEAKQMVDDFHSGFPQVSKWMEETENFASTYGYVEDLWGRRRRLPDVMLPEYSFKLKQKSDFNPLLNTTGVYEDQELIAKYKRLLNTVKYKRDYDKIKTAAEAEGLQIIKNGGFISRARRQSVNARIQGSAATMTKKAMIAIYNDKIMNDLGFDLLIGVHDELIGECPEENAEQVSERLTYLMKSCVPELCVPLKCDPTIEEHWYEEEYIKMIKKESETLSFDELCKAHVEVLPEKIQKYLAM